MSQPILKGTDTMRSTKWLAALVAASAIAVAVAGCGSTTVETQTVQTPAAHHHPRQAAGGMTKAQADHVYLADVAPYNTAVLSMFKEFQHDDASTTTSIAAGQVKPAIAAIQTTDGRLDDLADQYRPAAADIRAMVNSDAGLLGDLVSINTVDGFNVDTWGQQVLRDVSQGHAAANMVRSDLGLPQS